MMNVCIELNNNHCWCETLLLLETPDSRDRGCSTLHTLDCYVKHRSNLLALITFDHTMKMQPHYLNSLAVNSMILKINQLLYTGQLNLNSLFFNFISLFSLVHYFYFYFEGRFYLYLKTKQKLRGYLKHYEDLFTLLLRYHFTTKKNTPTIILNPYIASHYQLHIAIK